MIHVYLIAFSRDTEDEYGKMIKTPDKITPLFLTARMLLVHTLSIKVLLFEETLVGLAVVGKTANELNNKLKVNTSYV